MSIDASANLLFLLSYNRTLENGILPSGISFAEALRPRLIMKKQDVIGIAKELQLESSGRLDLVYFHGQTMFHFLQEGDELIVQPVDWNDIVPGDVVTHREELKFPTRRVIEVRKDKQLIVKADHQPPRRFYIVPELDVLGKVVARKRGGDWLFAADEAWLEGASSALRKAQEILESGKYSVLQSGAHRPPTRSRNDLQTSHPRKERTRTMDLEALNALIFLLHEDYDAARYCLAPLEAERVRIFVQQQQLAGYLYALHQEVGDQSPLRPDVAFLLKGRYLEQWGRTEKLMRELSILGKRFREADQDFIVLKGPYLASRFYGDVDRREIHDIDLLVRRNAFATASRLVQDCGFRCSSRVFLSEGLMARFVHHKEFKKKEVPLDLHQVLRAYPGMKIREEMLWKHRAQIDLPGGPYSVLSDEHTLLNQLLSIHHDIGLGTITLRGLVDLFMILRRCSTGTDWAEFLAQREEEGTLSISLNVLALTLALFRCEELFPEATEQVRARSDRLVRPPDTDTVLGLLNAWPLHKRKAWAFRQYPVPFLLAVAWWIGGMPFFFAAHHNLFFTNLRKRLRGARQEGRRVSDESPAIPTLRALGVTPDTLQQGILRFGSLSTSIHFNAVQYIEMLRDLFRINLPEPCPDGADVDIEIYLIEADASHVPPSNGWFIRHAMDGPVHSLIVHRDFDGVTSIYHDVVSAHIYENETPPRVVIAVLSTGQSYEHLLHCLMVVFYKILFFFDRAHLHAAAVRMGKTVNLFYGPKGAGKTTICIHLGRNGGTVLAEDHVMLRKEGDRFWVSGCDGLMRITEKTEQYFFEDPVPSPQVSIAGSLKKEFNMSAYFSCRQWEDMKVDRIFFASVDKAFSVRPIPASSAMDRLQRGLDERYRFANPSDRRSFDSFLEAFTGSIESYELELDPDLDELPKLTAFLERQDNA